MTWTFRTVLLLIMTRHQNHATAIQEAQWEFNDIRFLLSFVTTSEHIQEQSFYVPRWIAERSPYLNSLISHTHIRSGSLCIQINDVCPSAFGIYIEWLHLDRISLPRANSNVDTSQIPKFSTLIFKDCISLIRAHILGSQFQHTDFQDRVIDEIAHVLDLSQTPDVEVLTVVFGEIKASKALRSFIIDRMFAAERKMLGMLRGYVVDALGGSRPVSMCKYHAHEKGRCYRDSTWPQAYHEENMRYSSFTSNELLNRSASASRQLGFRDTKTHGSSPSISISRNISFPSRAIDLQHINPSTRPPKIHDSRRRVIRPPGPTNKPLPTLPVHRLMQTPLPMRLNVENFIDDHTSQKLTTKDIVYECLNRLRVKTLKTSSPLTISDTEQQPSLYVETPSIPHVSLQSELSQSPLKTLSSIGSVRRKPAPLRGEDWIGQYDCVNSYVGRGENTNDVSV